jgi:hypothetical protein
MELGEDGIILLILTKTVVPDKASWMSWFYLCFFRQGKSYIHFPEIPKWIVSIITLSSDFVEFVTPFDHYYLSMYPNTF